MSFDWKFKVAWFRIQEMRFICNYAQLPYGSFAQFSLRWMKPGDCRGSWNSVHFRGQEYRKYPLPVQMLRYIFWYRLYRVSQEECTKLRESVPYVKLYRYNPKHLYPKLNGYGNNGHRKVWASGVSTYCKPSMTPYSSTAHARQRETTS